MVSASSLGSLFWKLDLADIELEEPEALPETPTSPPAEFWKLPLPLLDDDIELEKAAKSVEPLVKERPPKLVEEPPAVEPTLDEPQAEPSPSKTSAEQITDMLSRCQTERIDFDRNLRELEEVQARLKTLIAKAGEQTELRATPATGKLKEALAAASGKGELQPGTLPPEILAVMLWALDFESLGRVACACREWNRFCRAEERWLRLLSADWGVSRITEAIVMASPSAAKGKNLAFAAGKTAAPLAMVDYRSRLARWQAMQRTLSGLKGNGCPGGVCGSLARRRLFEALETLAELGAAEDPRALYPSRVRSFLCDCEAWRTLLALLDDDSPHLMWLAVRCLADLAGSSGETRLLLREEVVRRGALIRELLEGDDIDLVEASARLMLNLHGEAPGVPLGACHRGPVATLESQGYSLHLQQEPKAVPPLPSLAEEVSKFSPSTASPSSRIEPIALSPSVAATWAQAWSGVWVGEMCYARGGERHAALRLILGLEGDASVERATETLRSVVNSTSEHDDALEAAFGEGGSSSSSSRRAVRAGANAEYWHFFGFLANSDFDCPLESSRYIDEQIRRRHQPSSPTSQSSLAKSAKSGKAFKLVGAGWDDQNGLFTVEAKLPNPPSALGRTSGGVRLGMSGTAEASAVPLRLSLRYERSWSTYELTAFLTDGSPATTDKSSTGRVPVLYGVWATAPSQHKHLFVLRRTGPLDSVV